ncbi:hypothetical protein LSH36_1357g00015 [Paralvinella palmiformis]|uniref:DUF7402 domain-containing protein n=1 Tax=Paralvinella palmiformis TaxID=53620 RepID=A0AAD9MQI6_9ANNE|nr:hypothetical protein LSH36_1357g00015 [Paralvinella palmiformis]
MKPPESHQIFDIQASASAQCIYICLQNTKCLMVVYDENGLLCKGYRTLNTIEPLGQTVKAWQILYKDESENLARRLSTTCTASSQYLDQYKCSNALDGSVEPVEGNDWAAKTYNVGEWIMVAFSLTVRLDELELWHRCSNNDRARMFELNFSESFTLQARGTCDGSTNILDCKAQVRFSRFTFVPAVMTDWVKITEIESCVQTQNRHFGFTKVKVIGRPLRK